MRHKPCVTNLISTLQSAIVPIGGAFAVVLWLGNAAYLYLSVSFIQMLKVQYAHTLAPSMRECRLLAINGPIKQRHGAKRTACATSAS